jgi:hypothetical protein
MNGLDGCVRNRGGNLGLSARAYMHTITTVPKRDHSCARLAHRRNRGMIQVQSAPAQSVVLKRKYATISHLSSTGDVLGATRILKKNKTESKENHSGLVAGPPWPPII